ncbi:Usherin [Dirofilaria immitis]
MMWHQRFKIQQINITLTNRDIAHSTACFDLQGGPGRYSMLAERFSIPANSGDKGDVSVSRLTCITSGYVRIFWLKAPYGADFHVYQPNSAVVTIAHGSDCGHGGGKLQISATLYYLRQADIIS